MHAWTGEEGGETLHFWRYFLLPLGFVQHPQSHPSPLSPRPQHFAPLPLAHRLAMELSTTRSTTADSSPSRRCADKARAECVRVRQCLYVSGRPRVTSWPAPLWGDSWPQKLAGPLPRRNRNCSAAVRVPQNAGSSNASLLVKMSPFRL